MSLPGFISLLPIKTRLKKQEPVVQFIAKLTPNKSQSQAKIAIIRYVT